MEHGARCPAIAPAGQSGARGVAARASSSRASGGQTRKPQKRSKATKSKANASKEEEHVELASGPSPVFASAARHESGPESDKSSDSQGGGGKKTIDWSNPGLNVLERARLSAEEGWEEAKWEELGDSVNMETYQCLLPQSFIRRRKATEAPASIKEHIELHQLGKRTLRKWPRGEHRPKHFSGSDPAHNGMRDSIDDGKIDTLGRMAVAVHKGFLRLRATCHPSGLRGQPGVFPLAERPEVAFIGCSNVGKSSMLNAITRTMKLAEAADDPGVTRSINWYKCSRLPIDVIDLPGYGFAKGSDFGGLLTDFVCTRKALRTLYVLLDARCGLRPRDWEWLQLLGDGGPEKVFILTKTDLVIPKDLAKVATIVLEDLECVPRSCKRLLLVSARNGTGMHDLRCHMAGRAVAWAKQAQRRAERLAQEAEGRGAAEPRAELAVA